jgi:hypothetical protein
MAENDAVASPEIREFYNDFVPPRYVRKLVSRLVSSVPQEYLRGLDCIVLTNQSGLSRRGRLGKVTSRNRRVPQNRVLGRYHHANHSQPAWIELYVDKLSAEAGINLMVPFRKTICFSFVLFHEIGHHIDETVRPEFREKEDTADSWSKKLMRNYMLQKYGFPKPVWRVLGWILKAIAEDL